jgi:hypothetical protein
MVLTELKEAVSILAQNYKKQINDPSITKYINIIDKYKKNRELFRVLETQFRPSQLEVGTVGAYLWGCNQNYYGEVNKACSALCVGNLKYENNRNLSESIDYNSVCQYQIWYLSGENFKCLNKVSTIRAYIYVPIDWSGFYEGQIDTLKENGIAYATILTTSNSQHRMILPMTPLENLPIIKSWQSLTEKSPCENSSSSINEQGSYFFWYILIIILILVSILFYRNNL